MFYRKFNLPILDVVVVGCGGTGSRIIPPLVQLLKTGTNSLNPQLFLVDGDVVEHKNLSRQNFITPDIGRNKSQVLAERYGQALDFPITYIPDYIVKGNLSNLVDSHSQNQGLNLRLRNSRKIIILCVDTVEARRHVLENARYGDVIIDSGNEDSYGQVSIFDTMCVGSMVEEDIELSLPPIKPFIGEYKLPFIPAPTSTWEAAVRNPPVATGSCADLDQSLAINYMMAAGIINTFQNLVYNNKFYYRTMFFDLHRGNSCERMTPVWLAQEFSNALHSDLYPGSMWAHSCACFINSIYNKRGMSPSMLYKTLFDTISSDVDFVPDNLVDLLK